jgi:hypothetical protein
LLIQPISYFIPIEDRYRFTGPAIGVVMTLSWILVAATFLEKNSLVLLISILINPVMNQLTLVSIGLLSSQLSLLFYFCLLLLFLQKKVFNNYSLLCILCLLVFALGVTVPYFFIQLLPVFGILLAVLWMKRNITFMKLLALGVVLSSGLVIGFFHVYLQSTILGRYGGFPSIPVAQVQNEQIANVATTIANTEMLPKFYTENAQNPFLVKYLIPLSKSFLDVIRPKGVRPLFESMLSFGAYSILFFSVGLCVYSWRKNNTALFSLSLITLLMALITQTGILEMSYYKGRTGWYLLLNAAFLVSLFYKEQLSKYFSTQRYVLIFLIILLSVSTVSVFVFPPKFYRLYPEEYFLIVSELVKKHQDEAIMVATDIPTIKLLSKRITISFFDPYQIIHKNDFDIVLIDKQPREICPIKSQQQVYEDKDGDTFLRSQVETRKETEQRIQHMFSIVPPDKFTTYWDNQDLLVLIGK